jgi:hypothetical protein
MNFRIRRELDWLLGYIFFQSEMHKDISEAYPGNKGRLQVLFDILILDGLISQPATAVEGLRYRITPKGRRFHYLNGYISEGKKDLLKTIWNMVVITAGVLNAIALLWMGWIEIHK